MCVSAYVSRRNALLLRARVLLCCSLCMATCQLQLTTRCRWGLWFLTFVPWHRVFPSRGTSHGPRHVRWCAPCMVCCMCTVASVSYFPISSSFFLVFAQHTQFSAKGRRKANPHAMSSVPDELFGRWLMTTFNGTDLSHHEGPFLMKLEPAGGLVHVSIQVSNVMNGNMECRDGKLYGQLISTRMLGPPLHMTIELALGTGFENGMAFSIEGAMLTFSQGENTFVFVAGTDSAQE
ncbi:hypothetical protein MOQ_007529 [Trypanosoma cruzi marinkellei]|uniref:DUF306 domain-containing protein n=1 Tax=Trypanosoma cruzi marinkellei TaxID=85056 RepID=K2MNM4_TRYCR|nr:hypothetical protein MOQ_007529 [Trypanosoma cruzi marinkellei]